MTRRRGYKLAAVGAIRAEILPQEEISLWLGQQLQEQAPLVLETTYDLESSDVSSILPGGSLKGADSI